MVLAVADGYAVVPGPAMIKSETARSPHACSKKSENGNRNQHAWMVPCLQRDLRFWDFFKEHSGNIFLYSAVARAIPEKKTVFSENPFIRTISSNEDK